MLLHLKGKYYNIEGGSISHCKIRQQEKRSVSCASYEAWGTSTIHAHRWQTSGKLCHGWPPTESDGLPIGEMASMADRWPPNYWDQKTGLFQTFL